MQATEKKRPREEKEFIHRLRPFAKLQTATDFEAFTTDLFCKSHTFDIEFRVHHLESDPPHR